MTTPAPQLSPRATILLLAAIAALGSLATQLLVPALPQLAHDLHTSAGDAQLVIGVFLTGLGAGQLIAGPFADRIGRKPVLLAGLVLYCIGSAGAALAPSLPLLLLARAVQALGGSAGVVSARVLVGDLFPPDETARWQATLMAVVLISPALAPVIGGALTEFAGWRTLFAILAVLGVGGVLLAAVRLPEGKPPPPPGEKPRLGASLRVLARNRRFLGPVATIACGSSALYMFLGNAPFLLVHDHGLRPREVGLAMMLVAGASIAGTFCVARIERRGNALLAGAALIFIASAALLVLALAGIGGVAAFMAPMTLLGLGAGMSGPAGITRVIRSQPGLEGTSTSLAGATQMLSSALAGYVLGRFAPVDVARLGLGLLLASSCALAATVWSREAR